MPGWAAARGLGPDLAPGQFRNPVLGLTLTAALIFLTGRTLQRNRPVQLVLAATIGALPANAASHTGLSLATRSVMPGLPTALYLVLPANA